MLPHIEGPLDPQGTEYSLIEHNTGIIQSPFYESANHYSACIVLSNSDWRFRVDDIIAVFSSVEVPIMPFCQVVVLI